MMDVWRSDVPQDLLELAITVELLPFHPPGKAFNPALFYSVSNRVMHFHLFHSLYQQLDWY
jgi:hypothetical protein